MITVVFFALYCLAAFMCRKDPILFKIVCAFSLVHFVGIFYYPSTWVDLCLEATLCTFLAKLTLKYSTRKWAIAIGIIMLSATSLILIELIDYWLYNSYFEHVYLQWVNLQTLMEITVFILASNGLLHSYTNVDWFAGSSGKHHTYF